MQGTWIMRLVMDLYKVAFLKMSAFIVFIKIATEVYLALNLVFAVHFLSYRIPFDTRLVGMITAKDFNLFLYW